MTGPFGLKRLLAWRCRACPAQRAFTLGAEYCPQLTWRRHANPALHAFAIPSFLQALGSMTGPFEGRPPIAILHFTPPVRSRLADVTFGNLGLCCSTVLLSILGSSSATTCPPNHLGDVVASHFLFVVTSGPHLRWLANVVSLLPAYGSPLLLHFRS